MGALRVVPDNVQFVDVRVSGKIIESTGAKLALQVMIEDSTGRYASTTGITRARRMRAPTRQKVAHLPAAAAAISTRIERIRERDSGVAGIVNEYYANSGAPVPGSRLWHWIQCAALVPVHGTGPDALNELGSLEPN